MDTSNSSMQSERTHDPDAHRIGLAPEVREVFDSAPMLIWISGPDKLCTWFNRPWLDFTGRTMQQELGNGWAEGVHPDDLERCLTIYTEHFDEQRPFRMQYRLRADDGTHRWIDDTGIPRYRGDGSFLGYIGTCIDIHHLQETESELRALRQELWEMTRHTETSHQPQRDQSALQFGPTLVARELNGALKTVLGNLESAQRHIAPGMQETHLARMIGTALQAARQTPPLVDRLLTFTRRYDQP